MADAWVSAAQARIANEEAGLPPVSVKMDRLQIVNECLFVIVVPLVYDGLLAISYMIHDPFGEDMLDFPIAAYLATVIDNCYACQHAVDMWPGCFEKLPPKDEPASPTS